MNGAVAPPQGWYPDPEGGVRLRWWDGADWTTRFRSRPSPGELLAAGQLDDARRGAELRASVEDLAASARDIGVPSGTGGLGGMTRTEAEELINQARVAARSEVNRAADVFSQRARTATQELEPLISQYTSRFFRWLKIALVVIVVLVIAWFVFAAIAEVTFFDWLGDRIDNVGGD